MTTTAMDTVVATGVDMATMHMDTEATDTVSCQLIS